MANVSVRKIRHIVTWKSVVFMPALQDGWDCDETLSQGFTLHPIEEDLSIWTPALAVLQVPPPGESFPLALNNVR
jgi:hypothetical protein